jgi:exopolyphosphatase/guanosine-5'-triphosphate,3'-diphosphate pyrophosphatase
MASGDLGGGGVELVPSGTETPSGRGSLPLGPLRLAEFSDNRKAVIEQIEETIAAAPTLKECAGRSLYLVGGAWRAIARLHIEQTRYPLHIIHQYTIARRPAEGFLDVIAAQSRRSLERITGIGRRRLEVVPLAATILRRLIAFGKPDRLVFSAFGLREGYAYGVLPRKQPDTDPPIAVCITMAERQGRSGGGDRLQRWIAPVSIPTGIAPAPRRPLAQRPA